MRVIKEIQNPITPVTIGEIEVLFNEFPVLEDCVDIIAEVTEVS